MATNKIRANLKSEFKEMLGEDAIKFIEGDKQ